MKLAEALIERAETKRQIQQIVVRMKKNAQVQEGDEPAENVAELYTVYESMMEKLETLIIRINKTNSETLLDGISLADAIAKRDCVKAKISANREVLESATAKATRYSNSEIKYVRTVDVAKTQRVIDDYSKQYRELDTKIQARNWDTELL